MIAPTQIHLVDASILASVPQPIPFHSIDRKDRVRIDYGDVAGLAESLLTQGFIHPVCIRPDNTQLIAGGRRMAALEHLITHPADYADLPVHSSMQSFMETKALSFGIHYTFHEADSQEQVSLLELVENVVRHNFSWQEEVIAITKIHNLKRKEHLSIHETWTQKQTGALLGVSQASLSNATTLAGHLSNPDSPLWKCSSPVEAFQHLAKLAHDAASKDLADRVRTKAGTLPTITSIPGVSLDPSAFIQKFDPSLFSAGGLATFDLGSEFDEPVSASPNVVPFNPATISEADTDRLKEAYAVVTKMVHNLKFEDMCEQLSPECVDHVLCDPPYAIDMGMLQQTNQGQDNIDRIADTHDVVKNMEDFPKWLAGCYKILRPKGFCVWFCDQMQWQYLYDEAIKAGFKIQRWPFVWNKTTSCSNQRAEYNFTKATEIAMVMRKGDGRLVAAQSTNYWLGGLTPEDKQAGVNHPFIKPKALWDHLLKAIALPGSTICDGFSGVGSSTRAMMLGGYIPLVSEMDENHYSQQIHNLTKIYCELNGITFKC